MCLARLFERHVPSLAQGCSNSPGPLRLVELSRHELPMCLPATGRQHRPELERLMFVNGRKQEACFHPIRLPSACASTCDIADAAIVLLRVVVHGKGIVEEAHAHDGDHWRQQLQQAEDEVEDVVLCVGQMSSRSEQALISIHKLTGP